MSKRDREPEDAVSPGTGADGGVSQDSGASQEDASLTPMSEPLRLEGEACDEPAQCASGYCDHGLCCVDGHCCTRARDCDQDAGADPICEKPSKCQGTRVDVVCMDFRCTTREGVADDRACDEHVTADECGPYLAVTCSGKKDQKAPRCPTACEQDDECDADAHCDGTCRADERDGEGCDEDSDCESAHCNGGVCCEHGDCCRTPDDCATHAGAARCTEPANCQGERVAATCRDFVCGSETVQDDSGCGRDILARACGPSADQFCDGTADQSVACPSLCLDDDSLCDPDAHCDGRYCTADLRDGERCAEASDCESNHCDNGLCCASGECCQSDMECPGMVCGASYRCTAPPMSMP